MNIHQCTETDTDETEEFNPKRRLKIQKRTKFKSLISRSCPNSLTAVIAMLSDRQRLAVASIGLSGILELRVSEIPMKMAYFVVDAYDHGSSLMILENERFKVKKSDVNKVLGLPLGGEKILRMSERCVTSEELLIKWKQQFKKAGKSVKCSDIVSHLVETGDDGFWFKLNFLVIFFSTMVHSSKNQYANPKILNYITGVDDIRHIDWCEYIIYNLKKSKKIWLEEEKKQPFTGPLLFLVVSIITCLMNIEYSV